MTGQYRTSEPFAERRERRRSVSSLVRVAWKLTMIVPSSLTFSSYLVPVGSQAQTLELDGVSVEVLGLSPT